MHVNEMDNMSANIGRIVGVNGNLITVEFDNPVIQNEVLMPY